MNREDIERMAREAKGHPYTNRYTPGETAFAFSIDRLEHFASLVYARGFAAGMKNEEQITREEVAAEREACAKVCDELAADVPDNDTDSDAINACAAAIRARGNP
jgi:hypothetical protein